MYADAVTTVVLEVQSNPNAQKLMEARRETFHLEVFIERLELMLHDMFGEDCVACKDGKKLSVTVDGVTAFIDPETRMVEYQEGSTEEESLREMVEVAVQRLYDALSPVF
ncbi:hypothetical protein LDENG_00104730 [Lucifuga dentata]|nr:hypothetical protein LDENG_00104730 [Lucifuga dentata]